MDAETVHADRTATAPESRERAIRPLLEAQLLDGFRLATWILRDPMLAEDAVAEAMLKAWERRRSLRDDEAAEAWFSRILLDPTTGRSLSWSLLPPASGGVVPEPHDVPCGPTTCGD